MNDFFMKGLIAGLLGTIGDVIIHWTAYFLFYTTTTAHYIAQLIFPVEKMNLVQLAIGFGTHYFAGALTGVMLIFFSDLWGRIMQYGKDSVSQSFCGLSM